MTKSEFIEETRGDIWALYEFCNENDYEHFFEELYSNDARNDYINEDMCERARDEDWQDMRDWLNDIESDGNYDWWYRDAWDEWHGVDDDYIEYMIDEIVTELEADNFFEEEVDEGEDETAIEEKISNFFKVL